MVKLTPDLITLAAQYINPVRDRELDLRGYKIPIIENLGATLDQFDTIDFSDNDVRKLDGFPLLKRLKSLLFNNNRICRVADNLEESLPVLDTLILTNNQIQNLGDIDPLASVKTLTFLSLLKNPVTVKKHYRLYIINKLPQLRVLDFRRIRQKERQEASDLFKGKKGKQLEKEIGKRTRTFVPGGSLPSGESKAAQAKRNSDAEAIKAAIAKASTLEEVERLNQMLKSGQLPSGAGSSSSNNSIKKKRPSMDEEEEEMDQDINGN